MVSWQSHLLNSFASGVKIIPADVKKTVLQLAKERFPKYTFIRSDKEKVLDKYAGLCDYANETITLSKKAGLQTFLHELGHALYNEIYGNLHKCYTQEGIVELFSWLVMFEGYMKEAYANSRQGWPYAMLIWVMYYENVSKKEAKKLKKKHKIRTNWSKAKKYALKLWNTPFGQELTKMIKDGAEIGF